MIPVVLHHGLFGFTNIRVGRFRISYFPHIDRAIQSLGHPLILSRVHPTSGIEVRARQLKSQIIRALRQEGLAKERVLIIAHSMGGLDARYMISRLGMAEHVAGLLTITTPHRGSPYADWCRLNLGKRLGGLRLIKLLNLDLQAIGDLTTESCRRFNDEIEDVPGVRYFSISAARPWHRVPPFAIHSHRMITAAEGANDALVSVKSSTWGEHLGTWPADHWHTINHRMFVELKDRTGDITPYYLRTLAEVVPQLAAPSNPKSKI
jgi:triacylglycerol lipase